MKKTLIAPSILSADFSRMGEEIKAIEKAGADLIHCDVMDGVFVPNITFGIKMIADIRKVTSLPLDVHLMIVNPEKYVERFIDAGADIVTIHYEAASNAAETLKLIKSKGVKAGIVISPDTDVSVLSEAIKHCDLALLMSVYPGFGGQKFIEKSYERLRHLKKLADENNPEIMIEIDGGVNFENIEKIVECGANVIVAGNTVFCADDAAVAIEKLKVVK